MQLLVQALVLTLEATVSFEIEGQSHKKTRHKQHHDWCNIV
jgi:hypothetical protein